jgi:hypothetical protein
MKNLLRTIIVFTTFLFSFSAFAETQWREKPVQCGDPTSLHKFLDEAGEKAILGGIGEIRTSQQKKELWPVYVFVNTDTGTFTIVEIHLDSDEACIIAYGDRISFDVQKYFDKEQL